MNTPIYFFSKTNQWYELSNFYLFGFMDEEGLYWSTVEHYFQAMKFPGEKYQVYREKIRLAQTPGKAKKLGQTRQIPLRRDWETVKEEVMLYALRKKFSHPKMKKILLATENRHLYENSPYDYYWGIGKKHTGKNRLGELLMQVREELLNP
ncbi:MAG: NADAR family protein [Crocosphaera sp.]